MLKAKLVGLNWWHGLYRAWIHHTALDALALWFVAQTFARLASSLSS